MLGVAVESSTTTSRPTTSTTAPRPSTSSTTGAPATTAASTTTAPLPAPTTTAPRPATTASPATAPPTTAAPTTTTTAPPTVQTVSGSYVSPDGDGIIEVQLQRAATGAVVAKHVTGPSGGDFSFAVDPGTYRLQITDAGPGPSPNRTSSQVVTRTDSFTLEAGRSARFACHVRTGCTGGVR